MNYPQRKIIYVSPGTQYPERKNLQLEGIVPDFGTRGKRIAQARRLWAAVLGEDLSQQKAGALIGVSGATWSRWESDDDTPRRTSLEAIAKQSADFGLPTITASWLDYNEGEGAPVIGKAPAKKEGRGAREGLHGERLVRPSALKKKRRTG